VRFRLLLLPLVLALAACGGGDDESASTAGAGTTAESSATVPGECQSVEAPAAKPDGGQEAPEVLLVAGKTYSLTLQTSCGPFTVKLDPKSAPKATASLVSLAKSGFYDGTTFHRVVPGFVIQGGDPTGTGTGGPGYTTVDAPPIGTIYTEGVVAMAKGGADPAGTAGSQFFVVTAPDAGLPPDYAVVGNVTKGMETVSAIEALGTGDGPPSQPVVIEKVTVEES
jgi:peptidyl-prolyl cis-trans isomerase B (cyclophilin B)